MRVIFRLFGTISARDKAFHTYQSRNGARDYHRREVRENGQLVVFAVCRTLNDAYRFAGRSASKLHWHFAPAAEVAAYMSHLVRTHD